MARTGGSAWPRSPPDLSSGDHRSVSVRLVQRISNPSDGDGEGNLVRRIQRKNPDRTADHVAFRRLFHRCSTDAPACAISPGHSVLTASFATRGPRVQIPSAPLKTLVRAISVRPTCLSDPGSADLCSTDAPQQFCPKHLILYEVLSHGISHKLTRPDQGCVSPALACDGSQWVRPVYLLMSSPSLTVIARTSLRTGVHLRTGAARRHLVACECR